MKPHEALATQPGWYIVRFIFSFFGADAMKRKTLVYKETKVFPCIEELEIDEVEDRFEELRSKFGLIQRKEIEDSGLYLFWVRGQRPTFKEVNQLVAEAGYDLVQV